MGNEFVISIQITFHSKHETNGRVIGCSICKTQTITTTADLSAPVSGKGKAVVGIMPFHAMLSKRLNIDTQRKLGEVDWSARECVDIPKWCFDGRGPE